MKVFELLEELNEICPFAQSEPYDNTGLIIGSEEGNADSILISLDVTLEIAEEAARKKCDVIISHHPVIFDPLKRIDAYHAKLISLCEENAISVIACHTNADLAGMGLEFLKELHLTELTKEGYYMRGSLQNAVCFETLIETISRRFQPVGMRSVGNLKELVRSVAFIGGAGGREDFTKEAKADVLITSEIKYSLAIKAKETGLKLIEMGHGESEMCFCRWMQKKLSRGMIAQTPTIPYN